MHDGTEPAGVRVVRLRHRAHLLRGTPRSRDPPRPVGPGGHRLRSGRPVFARTGTVFVGTGTVFVGTGTVFVGTGTVFVGTGTVFVGTGTVFVRTPSSDRANTLIVTAGRPGAGQPIG